MSQRLQYATAFAPATIGNVGVGFDTLGMAIKGVGDEVQVSKRKDKLVFIHSITGVSDSASLSLVAERNTAGASLLALQHGEKINYGFDVWIKKGIPMGSGMGGSAASAVGAIIAANQLLKKKLTNKQKLYYALEGEKVASGAAHPDNVAPCIMGGITLASLQWDEPMLSLPFPNVMGWVLVHPNVKVETKAARAILNRNVPLEKYVEQSSLLSCFLMGLFKKDLKLIRQGFKDVIIEPQRSHLIPGFDHMRQSTLLQKGVLGFSISGSGPSVFALTNSLATSKKIAQLLKSEFNKLNLETECYVGIGRCPGAHLVKRKPFMLINQESFNQ